MVTLMRILTRVAVLLFVLGMCLGARAQTYDVLVRGGRLLDGSGAPWRYADVGITGDRIVAVGRISAKATAKTVIEAKGVYVAPGYIDPHSHAGEVLTRAEEGHARALVAQGITSVFINPDGGGPSDLLPQLKLIRDAKPAVNVAPMIGHNSVRLAVMARDARDPTAEELTRMQDLVRAAMQAGAWGLTDGLFYVPATYSKTEEIIALAKVAAEFGGIYTAHVRDDADYNIGAVGAVDEVIRVAREAKLVGIVTHIKTMGPRGLGLSKQMIQHIDAARAEGIEIWADQHPYLASQSSFSAYMIPDWALAGGEGALQGRLANPETAAQIRAGVAENIARRGSLDDIQIANYEADRSLEGKRVGAIARERVMDPIDCALDLIKKARGRFQVVSFTMNQSDSEAFMRQPWTMTDTDGGGVTFGVGTPHPRSYGAFARKMREAVMEKRLLTLEQAIHAGTGLTAFVHGLQDRGFVREGARADVVVFNPAKVRDVATFEKPHAYAEGMTHVMVNGEFVLRDGKFTDARPGQLLLRPRE